MPLSIMLRRSSADSVDTHEDTEAQNTKAELEKVETV